MKTGLMQQQEVEAFYVLPAIRKELAFAMKLFGKKQKDIAKLLQIKESTVSQYLSEKRGSEFKLSAEVKESAKESAQRITDTLSMIREIQKLLKIAQKSDSMCNFHEKFEAMTKTK